MTKPTPRRFALLIGHSDKVTQETHTLKDLGLTVPNVNKRDKIPLEAIQTVVNHIAQTFETEKIILFGSYAYGTPKPWSDVDLLVIMETDKPAQKQFEIALSFQDPLGVDILVRTPQEIAHRVPLGDFFLREIITKGQVLYERIDARVASKSRQ